MGNRKGRLLRIQVCLLFFRLRHWIYASWSGNLTHPGNKIVPSQLWKYISVPTELRVVWCCVAPFQHWVPFGLFSKERNVLFLADSDHRAQVYHLPRVQRSAARPHLHRGGRDNRECAEHGFVVCLDFKNFTLTVRNSVTMIHFYLHWILLFVFVFDTESPCQAGLDLAFFLTLCASKHCNFKLCTTMTGFHSIFKVPCIWQFSDLLFLFSWIGLNLLGR
jgi:hypothetical protein